MTEVAKEQQYALELRGIAHDYGDGRRALDDVSLSVVDGEFLTLLGPSGCGKTTLLRTVGGFIRPSEGRVLLHGADVTGTPPHKRPVNMVFQRVTLFPHLDVFDNVAFGLRVSRTPKQELVRRVGEALELVRLEEFDRRRAHELSGGQIQRVALARALVNRPQVLLLDEPLSALDLKIRLEMEVELRRVHRETGATFVYVTHDQREALALSDRIAVFNHGHIEQVDTPDEIYRRPASPFAARFVGDANVVAAEVKRARAEDATVSVVGVEFDAPCSGLERGPVWLVLRQEALRVGPEDPGTGPRLRGVVRDVGFRGSGYAYRVEVQGIGDMLKAEVPAGSSPPAPVGTDVVVSWHPAAAWMLPVHPGDGAELEETSNVEVVV
jgi:putative spermidine/putrescine transport system ATP-binding protein